MVELCCWYCVKRKECSCRCVNNPLYCMFCAWFMEEECEDFELDSVAYMVLERLISEMVGG